MADKLAINAPSSDKNLNCVINVQAIQLTSINPIVCNIVYFVLINSQLETQSPLAPCNTNCSCSIARINPVCGGDKLTYFSPCHAGCSKVIGSKV